jgi:hypothetical protein
LRLDIEYNMLFFWNYLTQHKLRKLFFSPFFFHTRCFSRSSSSSSTTATYISVNNIFNWETLKSTGNRKRRRKLKDTAETAAKWAINSVPFLIRLSLSLMYDTFCLYLRALFSFFASRSVKWKCYDKCQKWEGKEFSIKFQFIRSAKESNNNITKLLCWGCEIFVRADENQIKFNLIFYAFLASFAMSIFNPTDKAKLCSLSFYEFNLKLIKILLSRRKEFNELN